MPNFFQYYPKTVYSKDVNSPLDLITNLTVNFNFLNDILDNSAVYYEYTVSEGDTPEIVAHKIYGYTDYHWIILKINNIVDVKTEWPLDYKSLTDSIESIYSSNIYADTANTSVTGVEWSKTTVKEYLKIETRTIANSGIIEIDEINIDQNTYNTTTTSGPTIYTMQNGDALSVSIDKKAKTYYEYEIEANEEKRQIKILKSEFVNPLIDEFKRVMGNG